MGNQDQIPWKLKFLSPVLLKKAIYAFALGSQFFKMRQSLIHSPGPPFPCPWVIGYFACSRAIPGCFHLGAEQLFCLPRAAPSKAFCSVSCCFAMSWFRKLPLPYRTIEPPQPRQYVWRIAKCRQKTSIKTICGVPFHLGVRSYSFKCNDFQLSCVVAVPNIVLLAFAIKCCYYYC